MANRRLTPSIPIWLRVSGIVALVLVGVFVSSMVLGGAGTGGMGSGGMGAGGHGGGSDMRGMDGDQADRNDGDMGGMDHNADQGSPTTPSASPAAPSETHLTEPSGTAPGPSGHMRPAGSRDH